MDSETKIFVSHASEDKEGFVRDFSELLRTRCHVWYDEYSLPFAAPIFRSISAGLNECDFGVVVLSPSFFTKKWTQDEIAALFASETVERRRIIPLWKDVTLEQVAQFSPILADRRGISCAEGPAHAVECVVQAIDDASRDSDYTHRQAAAASPEDHLAALGEQLDRHYAGIAMINAPDAPLKVREAQNSLFAEVEARIEQVALRSPKFSLTWNSDDFRCLPFYIKFLNVTLPNQDVFFTARGHPSKSRHPQPSS